MVAVTIIVPWKEGTDLNVPVHGAEDEALVISGGGIGEARIHGAKIARNEWLVMVDADGHYPDDYVARVKSVIESGKYPSGFMSMRTGGFATSYFCAWESAMVLPRSQLLEKVARLSIVPAGRWDIGHLYRDLPVESSITYYHGLTSTESLAAGLALPVVLGGSALYLLGRH